VSITVVILLALAGSALLVFLLYALSDRLKRRRSPWKRRSGRVAGALGGVAALLCVASIVVLALRVSGTNVGASSSSSTQVPVDFCDTHKCVAGFASGTGSVVQCADGQWSHDGGRPAGCSGHGGKR
jgi:amino acid transporter